MKTSPVLNRAQKNIIIFGQSWLTLSRWVLFTNHGMPCIAVVMEAPHTWPHTAFIRKLTSSTNSKLGMFTVFLTIKAVLKCVFGSRYIQAPSKDTNCRMSPCSPSESHHSASAAPWDMDTNYKLLHLTLQSSTTTLYLTTNQTNCIL